VPPQGPPAGQEIPINDLGDPGDVDAEIAGRTARRIRDYLASHPGEDPLEIHVERDDNEVLVVPRPGAAMLAQVMGLLENGEGVTLVPKAAQLTTQQAADMLNVSRPYLIGLLEAGQIEFTKVGRHRRVPFAALVEYKRHADQRARARADEMSELGQELGLERSRLSSIVTKDKDFTAAALRPWKIEAKSPDDFILDLIDISEKMVWGCVQQIVDARKRRRETVEDVLAQLERSGLVQSVAALRRNWA
jgi:excisionase family DNA binding protein